LAAAAADEEALVPQALANRVARADMEVEC